MNIKNINLYNIFWICHKILGIMSIIYFVYLVYLGCTFILYSNTEGICINNKCTFPTLSIYNYNNCVIQTHVNNDSAFTKRISGNNKGGGNRICYYCIKIHDYIYTSSKNDGCINSYTILTSIICYFTIPTIIKLIFFYNYQQIANKIIFYNQIVSINTLHTPLLYSSTICHLCLHSLSDSYVLNSFMNGYPKGTYNNNATIIIKTQCNHYFCYECMLKWRNNNCTHCPKCLNSIYL
jgi:hypothetical protein